MTDTPDTRRTELYAAVQENRRLRGWEPRERTSTPNPPRHSDYDADAGTPQAMTRPVKAAQLDALAVVLTRLATDLEQDGVGRHALAVLRDHANASGYPTNTLGGGAPSGSENTSRTERAAFPTDLSLGHYAEAVTLVRRILTDGLRLSRLLHSADPNRTLTVCPRCSVEVPAGKVRCDRCLLHPDSVTCANPECGQVLGEREIPRHGMCEPCDRFKRRNKRLPTRDDMRPRRDRADA